MLLLLHWVSLLLLLLLLHWIALLLLLRAILLLLLLQCVSACGGLTCSEQQCWVRDAAHVQGRMTCWRTIVCMQLRRWRPRTWYCGFGCICCCGIPCGMGCCPPYWPCMGCCCCP